MDRAGAAPSPTASRLARELVRGSRADALVPELERWLAGSARFRDFATANESKIRKKLRGAADPDALRDVRLELEVARLLIADRRVVLEWEPFGSASGGPDFGLTLPGLRSVNVEVTRLRRPAATAEAGVPWLAKLRQLPPGAPNIVVAAIDGPTADALDVAASVLRVRERADAKDEAFFAARGIAGSRAFYGRFLRLGAVLSWAQGGAGANRVAVWRHGSARIPVPDRIVRACEAALRDGGP